MNSANLNWSAADFFRRLTANNKFARGHGFGFAVVSSLEGFHAHISAATKATALVAVSDTSAGAMEVSGAPRTRRVKTVFLFMRHKVDDAEARQACFDKMEELFRQFMSVLLLEKTRVAENRLFIDDRISFTEIDKYFFTGGACAFFQIAVDTFTDLSYNSDEWLSTTP